MVAAERQRRRQVVVAPEGILVAVAAAEVGETPERRGLRAVLLTQQTQQCITVLQ